MADRLDELIGTIERGEPVDTRRFALLLDLEFVRLGRDHVQDSLARQQTADDDLKSFLESVTPGLQKANG